MHEAEQAVDMDHWIPISLVDTKSAVLSSDTDPKLWKEAMASYDATEWIEGLRDEMTSLQAHNVRSECTALLNRKHRKFGRIWVLASAHVLRLTTYYHVPEYFG